MVINQVLRAASSGFITLAGVYLWALSARRTRRPKPLNIGFEDFYSSAVYVLVRATVWVFYAPSRWLRGRYPRRQADPRLRLLFVPGTPIVVPMDRPVERR
jgi:hypothetical protein